MLPECIELFDNPLYRRTHQIPRCQIVQRDVCQRSTNGRIVSVTIESRIQEQRLITIIARCYRFHHSKDTFVINRYSCGCEYRCKKALNDLIRFSGSQSRTDVQVSCAEERPQLHLVGARRIGTEHRNLSAGSYTHHCRTFPVWYHTEETCMVRKHSYDITENLLIVDLLHPLHL